MTNSNSLLGQVGTSNYELEEFESTTAYQFSQFLENQANGLFDPHIDPTIPINPIAPAPNPITPAPNPITPAPDPNPIDPGETIDEALDLGIFDGDGFLTHTGDVGSSDPVDLYQFSVSQNNNFNFVLEGMSADVDLHLVNSSGEIIAASENYNTDIEILVASLPAGTYFLGAASYDHADTSYNLHVAGGEQALSIAEIDTVIDPSLTTEFVLI